MVALHSLGLLKQLTGIWKELTLSRISARTGFEIQSSRAPNATRLVLMTTVPQSFVLLRGQADYMRARGLEVEGVSSPGRFLSHYAQSEHLPIHSIPMTRGISPIRDVASLFRVFSLLRRLRPQILDAHTPKAGLLGMIGGRLAGVPVRIYHLQGLRFVGLNGYRRFVVKLAERLACQFASRVICVSNSILEEAVRERVASSKRATVLLNGTGNGIDAEVRFNPANVARSRLAVRATLGIPADAVTVGFLGRVVRDKGIIELASAWRAIRDLPSVHLLIAGPFESDDAVPPNVVESLRRDPKVHLLGYVEDTASIYGAMDFLVLPSYREGFGYGLLEAAAMELPTIATQIAGCVDAVEHGVTGVLVPVHDAEALATAMRLYVGSADLRREHGRAGRRRVLRLFTQESVWQALYEEYRRLLRVERLVPPSVD